MRARMNQKLECNIVGAGRCDCSGDATCPFSSAKTCPDAGVVDAAGQCTCTDPAVGVGQACEFSNAKTCSDAGVVDAAGQCTCTDPAVGAGRCDCSGDATCPFSNAKTCSGAGVVDAAGQCWAMRLFWRRHLPVLERQDLLRRGRGRCRRPVHLHRPSRRCWPSLRVLERQDLLRQRRRATRRHLHLLRNLNPWPPLRALEQEQLQRRLDRKPRRGLRPTVRAQAWPLRYSVRDVRCSHPLLDPRIDHCSPGDRVRRLDWGFYAINVKNDLGLKLIMNRNLASRSMAVWNRT